MQLRLSEFHDFLRMIFFGVLGGGVCASAGFVGGSFLSVVMSIATGGIGAFFRITFLFSTAATTGSGRAATTSIAATTGSGAAATAATTSTATT